MNEPYRRPGQHQESTRSGFHAVKQAIPICFPTTGWQPAAATVATAMVILLPKPSWIPGLLLELFESAPGALARQSSPPEFSWQLGSRGNTPSSAVAGCRVLAIGSCRRTFNQPGASATIACARGMSGTMVYPRGCALPWFALGMAFAQHYLWGMGRASLGARDHGPWPKRRCASTFRARGAG